MVLPGEIVIEKVDQLGARRPVVEDDPFQGLSLSLAGNAFGQLVQERDGRVTDRRYEREQRLVLHGRDTGRTDGRVKPLPFVRRHPGRGGSEEALG